MEKFKPKRKIWYKLKDRYRLVILNENTLEELWYTALSRINFIFWIGLFGIFLVAIGIILVSFTPLREYIPGYLDGNIRRGLIENTLNVDSLEQELRIRDQYIENIKLILKGKNTSKHFEETDSLSTIPEIDLKKTTFNPILKKEIDEKEKYNISTKTDQPVKIYEINKLHFYCPLKGIVTNNFDSKTKHFGIDIVSNLNEPVLSILDGTVIMAAWTIETGYIIIVQHSNDMVSIYKHNSQILKKMGDRISAGEAIAIVGNTGEYTTGPHLHFELWHNGSPLNPNNYIVF